MYLLGWNRFKSWEAINSTSAKVVVEDNSLTAGLVFYFNDTGKIAQVVTGHF